MDAVADVAVGAPMADLWIFLLAGASLVLLGFLAAQLFERYRLPDYFILMSIGLALGSGVIPIGGVNPRDSLAGIAPILTNIALAFILFEGGLVLHVRGMGRAWSVAAIHTGLAMGLAIGGMWWVATHLLGLGSITAILLALAFCGPSATIVLSFLPQVRVADRTRFTLTVEGVMGNIVAAVLVILVVQLPGAVADSSLWLSYLLQVATAVLLAYAAGRIWARIVSGGRTRSFAFMTSVALALFLYAIGEGLLGGNGGVAAFVFGLVLGHRRVLLAPTANGRGLQEFHRELVFLLRTFFFLYLGMRVDIAGITTTALLGAVAFTIVFAVSRWPSTAILAAAWRLPKLDRRIVRATVARGMTDTVLILYAIEAGVIPAGEASLVTDLLFLVVLSAAFASALLVLRAERIARREIARPTPTPAAAGEFARPTGAGLPQELDRSLSEFLADPIVRHGEID